MPGFPAPRDDEREQLLVFLEQQRSVLRLMAYGLTDDQARLRPSVSSLSVGGLFTHLTNVENSWTDTVLEQHRQPDPDAYERAFELAPDKTLAEALADYEAAAARTDATVRSLALDHPVPIPKDVPWFPKDVDAWTVRWVVLHLIEETARHAGHADIVRESIDGATWFPLLSASENWDLRPFVEPWEPAVA